MLHPNAASSDEKACVGDPAAMHAALSFPAAAPAAAGPGGVEATVAAMQAEVERYEALTLEGGWEDAFRRREDIRLVLSGAYLRAIAVRGGVRPSLGVDPRRGPPSLSCLS